MMTGGEEEMVHGKGFKSRGKSLKKQIIIDTALTVFHRKGYRSATLDDVAHELGLTRPAIYHYVSSKEDLLSQIYIQAMEKFFNIIYEIPAMELTPPEKLRLFISRHLNNVVIENLAMFSVFFSEENQLGKQEFETIQVEKRKFSKVIENIINDGMKQGFFRQVNARLQANAIIGMTNWLYRWYKPEQSVFHPDEIVEQFTSLVEKGLMKTVSESDIVVDAEYMDVHATKLRTKSQIMQELKASVHKTASLINELENYPDTA